MDLWSILSLYRGDFSFFLIDGLSCSHYHARVVIAVVRFSHLNSKIVCIMTPFNWTKELGRDGHRVMLSGQPFAMHCHHYNVNLQKTLEDALGEDGVRLLFRSAEEAIFSSFKYLIAQYRQIKTASTRFEMAALLFQNCGLGVLSAQELDPKKSVIISVSSHHVTGWLAKHGRRPTPGCHFSRGWVAGVLAAIFEKTPGFYDVTEVECKMMLDKQCVFHVEARQWP